MEEGRKRVHELISAGDLEGAVAQIRENALPLYKLREMEKKVKTQKRESLLKRAREVGVSNARFTLSELRAMLVHNHISTKGERRLLEWRLQRHIDGHPVVIAKRQLSRLPAPQGLFCEPPFKPAQFRGHPFSVPLSVWASHIFEPYLDDASLFAVMFSCKQFQACARKILFERTKKSISRAETPLALNAVLYFMRNPDCVSKRYTHPPFAVTDFERMKYYVSHITDKYACLIHWKNRAQYIEEQRQAAILDAEKEAEFASMESEQKKSRME